MAERQTLKRWISVAHSNLCSGKHLSTLTNAVKIVYFPNRNLFQNKYSQIRITENWVHKRRRDTPQFCTEFSKISRHMS